MSKNAEGEMRTEMRRLTPLPADVPPPSHLGAVIMAMLAAEGLDRDVEDRAVRLATRAGRDREG